MKIRHVVVAAALGTIAWGSTGAAGSAEQPAVLDSPGLTLSRAGLSAEGSLGTYCLAPACVDFTHPAEPEGRLPVHGRSRVTLDFTLSADRVHVALGRHGGGALHVERLSATRWTVRLPRKLHGARILDISVDGKDASGNTWDANFWGGIRSGCG
jgi:hypothetical protein